ncbi:pentatricopeptide repeat-containing protein At2g15980 [Asparagus officinalis]|uniref:pentatricopeptide repeat-containing protein At2g15980 n=1 Tax=Asparagus officinalis TaxID=4686 RepID=UPI00098E0505|nr:pentatricopeptide repeat-containing protein At2g15980 [Asparagus officinalis]
MYEHWTPPVSDSIIEQPSKGRANISTKFSKLFTFAPQIPRSLSTSGPEFESESETRISAAVTILLHHRSPTRWNRLKSVLPIGSTFSPPESEQIIIRIRNKPQLALKFFQTPLCSRDPSTFSTIIHVLARNRLKPETLALIRSAILSQPEPDRPLSLFQTLASTYRTCDSAPFVFDLLIKGYLQSKKIDLAVAIARILKSKGIQPLVSTSNALIRFESQSKGADAGFNIYKELFDGIRVRVSPNVATFNALSLGFYREGKLQMAEEIKKEMLKFNCEPNAFTYSIRMAGFCDEGMIDEATRIWIQMKANGTKPDVMSFNTMIKGYCESKEMEKAEELFKEMGLNQIEPSCATFEHLIQGYCRVNDIDSALVCYRDANRRGFGTENVVVDEVIEGLCNKKRANEGLEMLREVMRRQGFEPSRRSYELLIEGFCEEGEIEAAVKIQAEMAGKGFGANLTVYGYFVEGYRRLGDDEKVKRLEKEMVGIGLEREG